MSHLRFLRSWEWAGYLAAVIAFAIACVLLSQWQFDRRDQAAAQIARIETNSSAPAAALSALVPDAATFDGGLEYRTVAIDGTYLSDLQTLVRNRPMNGQPGFEVIVPLETDDGTVFYVDRGWLPTGTSGDTPDSIPAAPEGRVHVEARLKPAQPRVDRTAPNGQIASFALDQLSDQLGVADVITGAYGQMTSEQPAPAERPQAIPLPQPDEGLHLSYALQWIAFAVMGFVGFGYAIRTTAKRLREREQDEGSGNEPARDRSLGARFRRIGRDDADYEDEALDRR